MFYFMIMLQLVFEFGAPIKIRNEEDGLGNKKTQLNHDSIYVSVQILLIKSRNLYVKFLTVVMTV
jgi:hypothetical protein